MKLRGLSPTYRKNFLWKETLTLKPVRKGQKYFTNKIPATVKYNYNV